MDTFVKLVENAFARSRSLLFPVRKGVWLKLLLLYIFSGSCASVPGIPGKSSLKPKEPPAKIEVDAPLSDEPSFKSHTQMKAQESFSRFEEFWEEKRDKIYFYGGLIGAVVLIFTIFFMWVVSRLKMMIVVGLEKADIQLRQSWATTRELGNSYFFFNLWLFLVLLVILIPAGYHGYFYLKDVLVDPDWIELISTMILGMFVLFLVSSLIMIFDSFLPVVMVQRQTRILEALGLIKNLVSERMGTAFFMLVLYLLAAFVWYMVFFIAGVLMAILIWLPLTIFYGILIAIFSALGAGWIVFIVGGVVMAVLGFFCLLVYVVPSQTLLTYLRLELVQKAFKNQPISP